jgi:hypothetical protein
MGRNLLLNIDQKFAVAGLDLDEEKFFTHTRTTTPIKATIDGRVCRLIKQPRQLC